MQAKLAEFHYLKICLEAFFFGLYSGIFAIYLQPHRESQKGADKAKNFLFYALWALYALSAATVIVEILDFCIDKKIVAHLEILQVTVFACCDFTAQFILIYRCWIIWNCRIRVVIVPSCLAFAFLAIWIAAGTAPLSIVQGQLEFYTTGWGGTMVVTGLALSMTVNALVTGLIVFRIFKVFQAVKTHTADNQISGATGKSTLQHIIFILIESGMALFSIQLARLVVTIVATDTAYASAYAANYLVVGLHGMLNGITPTIILVRVSMGLSFHDESSMVEASIGSLRFQVAPDISLSSIPENRIVDEERRHDNSQVETKSSDHWDIQMVDR